MKRFFLIFTTIFIVSCSIDDKNEILYESYGVVKDDVNTSGKLYVRSDKGKVILPASNFLSNEDRDRRVWILYSTNSDINSDTIKASVSGFLKITNMDFKSQSDELKSDAVYLREIWVAQDYLTLIMSVAAGSENSLENHKYIMYSDWEIVNDTVRMEFKYDRNNDAINTPFNKIVALKLDDKIDLSQHSSSSVLRQNDRLVREYMPQSTNSVVLAIKYMSNTGSTKEVYVTYKK